MLINTNRYVTKGVFNLEKNVKEYTTQKYLLLLVRFLKQ